MAKQERSSLEKNCDASERWMLDRRSFLWAGLLGLGGCQSWFPKSKTDLFSSSETPKEGDVTYVSDLARVWGAAPTKIHGVGLVTELSGTGSAPRPSRFRDELSEELRVREVADPNSLLSKEDTSLVILTGVIPAGVRKGTPFDVMIGLDPGSDTTSLEGGYLMPARLNPVQATSGGKIMKGRFAANASGPVLTESLFRSGDSASKTRGVAAGGGQVMVDREIGFQMKSEHVSISEAVAVTKAINGRFNYIENRQREPVANAKSDQSIELEIPEIYRNNVYRYLHVLRNVAVGESAARQVSRMERLEQELNNPETSEVASLRLEAIGDASVAVLERALRSHHHKVQFMAAMALTYLGRTSGCATLAVMAREEWAFRWHALTALSALPQPEARSELQTLLHSQSVETRYGAVRSLIQRGESESDMSTERFGKNGENFAMTSVYSTADPVVHLAKREAPEVVVFNPEQSFQPGLIFFARNWTVKTRDDHNVEITHYRVDGDLPVRCTSMVTDVIRTMGKLGANYALVVQLLRQAAEEQLMEGKLVVDALPESDRPYSDDSEESGDGQPDRADGDEKESGESSLFGKWKGLAKGR